MNRRIFAAILMLVAICSSPMAFAQTTQTAENSFDEIEWAVFILDAATGQVNSGTQALAILPEFVGSRRQNNDGPTTRPSAFGIIRFTGQSDGGIDVLLKNPGGEFLASWPKAQNRSRQILWRNLQISAKPPLANHAMEDVVPGSFLSDLRATESAYISGAHVATERFLLYDVQYAYPNPLELKREKKSLTLRVGNTQAAALHHLVFYESVNGVWREAQAGDLKGRKMPATTQSATEPAMGPSTGPTTRPAATLAASRPATTQAVDLADVQMVDQPASSPAQLVAKWQPILRQRGLSDEDCKLIVTAIFAGAIESHKLAAVYLMDDQEFDRLLPEEVIPQPARIVRVGIVIMQNIDPNAGSEIDELIAQLGDPVWSKREAAFKTLAHMGTIPVAQLRKAIHNKDPEIAWRAEKLLAFLGLPAEN